MFLEMSGKTFKVKTADGESWEWDIHTADEDETKGKPEEDEVAWNRPAVVTLAVGLILCFVGLLTLLISIGLLFSGPGAVGGLIAGSVLLGAGFIVTTPSAVRLVRDPKEADDKDRGRSESVAIILPTPEFRKNVVPSKPQESAKDDRYLLAAERLTAMLEEPEAEAKEISTAAWTPSASPRTSPKTTERQESFGSSLTIPSKNGKSQVPRGSPRVIRRVNTSSIKKNQAESPPPVTFSALPPPAAIAVTSTPPQQEPLPTQTPTTLPMQKTMPTQVPEAVTSQEPEKMPMPIPGPPASSESDGAAPPAVVTLTLKQASDPMSGSPDLITISAPDYPAPAPPTESAPAPPTESVTSSSSASSSPTVSPTPDADANASVLQGEDKALLPGVRERDDGGFAGAVPSGDHFYSSTTTSVETTNNGVTTYSTKTVKVTGSGTSTAEYSSTISPTGSLRLKVAAPIAAPSVVEFDSDDDDLKTFLLSVKKQKDEDSAMLY